MSVCDFADMSHYQVGEPILLPRLGLPITDICMSYVVYDVEQDILYLAAEKDWDGEVRCCQKIVIAAINGVEFK
jgi:hypothetical protein